MSHSTSCMIMHQRKLFWRRQLNDCLRLDPSWSAKKRKKAKGRETTCTFHRPAATAQSRGTSTGSGPASVSSSSDAAPATTPHTCVRPFSPPNKPCRVLPRPSVSCVYVYARATCWYDLSDCGTFVPPRPYNFSTADRPSAPKVTTTAADYYFHFRLTSRTKINGARGKCAKSFKLEI